MTTALVSNHDENENFFKKKNSPKKFDESVLENIFGQMKQTFLLLIFLRSLISSSTHLSFSPKAVLNVKFQLLDSFSLDFSFQ
jgi:hypothetical protein